jgi:uncharacterized protein YkwD
MTHRYLQIVFCLLVPASGVMSCVAPTQVKVSGNSPDRLLASQVFDQVNDYRKDKGSGPLLGHPALNRMAEQHSEYMRENRGKFNLDGKNVSHMGSEGRAVEAMRMYHFISFSENVAAAPKASSVPQSAATLVTLWIHSPDHEAAMRNPEYTHTGVGIVTDADGTIFATQLFGTLTNSPMNDRMRFNGF